MQGRCVRNEWGVVERGVAPCACVQENDENQHNAAQPCHPSSYLAWVGARVGRSRRPSVGTSRHLSTA